MNRLLVALIFLLPLCLSCKAQAPVDLVNPFIGTSNYGATHPGPVRPNGMASVVPFNAAFKKGEGNKFEKDSEWHSRPYVHDNTFFTGFSHVNLSGVGCPDLGSLIVMPTQGELLFNPEDNGSTISDQESTPGYYSCKVDKHNLTAELTATKSKMFGEFCYTAEAVRPIYFVMKISKPSDDFGAWKKMPKYKGVEGDWMKYNDQYKPYKAYTNDLAGENIGAYFSYDLEEAETIEVHLGISYVSIENARLNLEKETTDQSFDSIKKEASQEWNELLSRITIKDDNQENKTLFYTALYHLLMHPNILQDVNGDYPAMESSEILNTGGRDRYTVFSMWDTYRNVHPFLSLVYPDLQSDMVSSLIDMYKEECQRHPGQLHP